MISAWLSGRLFPGGWANFREGGMRHPRHPQREPGEVRIDDIDLDGKSRDALLIGLQNLYSREALHDRPLALMDAHVLPDIDRKVGRPGMEMWRIPVMGVVKQGSGKQWFRETVRIG